MDLLISKFSKMAKQAKFESKNVPPYEIKGRGLPTTGIKPEVMARLINIWKKKRQVIPPAISLIKWLSLLAAMLKPKYKSAI